MFSYISVWLGAPLDGNSAFETFALHDAVNAGMDIYFGLIRTKTSLLYKMRTYAARQDSPRILVKSGMNTFVFAGLPISYHAVLHKPSQ